MSRYVVTMPQLGESVNEGTISRWLVKRGDRVDELDPMVEINTDKVEAEVPAPVTGTLSEILAADGAVVPVGAAIAVIEVEPEREDAPAPGAGPGLLRPSPAGQESHALADRVSGIDAETRIMAGTGAGAPTAAPLPGAHAAPTSELEPGGRRAGDGGKAGPAPH